MDLSHLKNSSSGHDSKQAERTDVRGARTARRLLCCCFAFSVQFICSGSFYTGRAIAKLFYLALMARFNGCRTRNSEKICALKLSAEGEKNTLAFTASSLLCLHSLVYCLKNRFLIQTTSCMIRIAMAIKPRWVTHVELIPLRKCLSQRGGKVCIFTVTMKKSQFAVTGYFFEPGEHGD